MAKRRYLDTHPWLDFELDMRSVRPDLWISLGETAEGARWIGDSPVDPASGEAFLSKVRVKGIHGSAALAGGLLEPGEVAVALNADRGESDGDDADLVRRIDGLTDHIDRRLAGGGGEWDISPGDIAGFDLWLARGGPVDDRTSSFRTSDAADMAYRGVPHEDCEYLLERLCSGLSEIRKGFPSRSEAVGAVLRGVFAHAYIAWIMPFGNSDCLTARMVEYQVLRSGGIPPRMALLLGWYYNRTSREYAGLLGRVSAARGELVPFIEYVLAGLIESVRVNDLETGRYYEDMAWARHLGSVLQGTRPDIRERRRVLAEEISLAESPVRVSRLLSLSSKVARAYAGISERTLARDVDALAGLGLLERDGRTVRALREQLRHFGQAEKRR